MEIRIRHVALILLCPLSSVWFPSFAFAKLLRALPALLSFFSSDPPKLIFAIAHLARRQAPSGTPSVSSGAT